MATFCWSGGGQQRQRTNVNILHIQTFSSSLMRPLFRILEVPLVRRLCKGWASCQRTHQFLRKHIREHNGQQPPSPASIGRVLKASKYTTVYPLY